MKGPSRRIALFLSLLMIFSTALPAFADSILITDIREHWAEEMIQSAVESGMIKGHLDGTFKPDDTISRAEFFTIINRSNNFTKMTVKDYGDVSKSAWYNNEVEKATAAGYITVEEGGMVEPLRAITREEAATIIALVKKLHASSLESRFNDSEMAADWSQNAIIAVKEANIMTGYPNGSFGPKDKMTRAEAVVTITKSDQYRPMDTFVYYEEKTYGNDNLKTVVDGNVFVSKAGAILNNLVINGNLTIGPQVRNGDVRLNNVEVKGATFVYGGGEDSVYFNSTKLNAVYVDKALSAVRLVASGNTSVKDLIVRSTVKLQEKGLVGDSTGFNNLLVESNLLSSEELAITLLAAECSNVDIKAQGVDLNLTSSSKISNLTIDGSNTRILGQGVIVSANVNAPSVSFDKKPINLKVAENLSRPTIKTVTSTSGGGGSSSGGGGSSSSGGGSSNGGGSSSSINTASALKTAIEGSTATINLEGNIAGNVVANRSASGAVTINFNGYSVNGDLDITANSASTITLNSSASEQISGDFIADAKGATITNNVAVAGKAILKNVAYHSYNANKAHGEGIDVKGRAKIVVGPSVTNVVVNIKSIYPVVLAGTVSELNIETAGASAVVEGTVEKVIVRKGATDANLQLTSTATVSSVKADENIIVLAENINTVTITIDTTGSATVTKKTAHLVQFDKNGGDDAPEPAFKYVENGEAIGLLPAVPKRAGYVFTGWNTAANGSGGSISDTSVINSSASIYAQWTAVVANTFAVSFESNGGTFVAPVASIASGANATLPTAPTRTGYIFAGWYTDDVSFANVFNGSTAVTADMIVYAKWTASSYKVHFESNDGSAIAFDTVTANGTLTLPAAPTKAGYTFAGWYTDYNLVDAFSTSSSITSDMTLYAKWTAVSSTNYTVTFNTNGGSTITSETVPSGAAIVLPTNPTRTGYEFEGWYTDVGLTTALNASTMITSDITLYAKWIQTVTITFDVNGGSAINPIHITTGAAFQLPATPTRSGYTFAGWFTDSGLTTPFTTSTTIVSSMTVYAKWTSTTPSMYTVTFDVDGGSTVVNQPVASGGTVTEPTAPTKSGYTFGGWYTESGLTNVFNFSTAITANKTLYAKWTSTSATMYTVTFDVDGGSTVSPVTVTSGATIMQPTTPTKSGYTFDGWYTESGLTNIFNFSTAITENKTLYAKWTSTSATMYTVTFDVDGGSTVSPVTVTSGATIMQPTTPTKSGYTFGGWYTESGLTNVFNFSTAITANKTLYAKWTSTSATMYTVTFDVNGGSAVSPVTVTSGATLVTVPTTTKAATTFNGWFKTEKYLTEFTGSTVVNDDTTVHASFTTSGATHMVVFMNETTAAATKVTTTGATVVFPTVTKTGYTFGGWYTQPNGAGEELLTSSKIYIDLTVYAKWN